MQSLLLSLLLLHMLLLLLLLLLGDSPLVVVKTLENGKELLRCEVLRAVKRDLHGEEGYERATRAFLPRRQGQ